MKNTLYNVDSKGKIRFVTFEVIDKFPGYEIKRSSGLVDGAEVPQPTLEIKAGKAGRCIKAQMELELASLINKAKDKGYKEEQTDLLAHKTDSKGNAKPMLAKDPRGKIDNKVSEEEARKIIITRINKIIANKRGAMSRKLDGVRMLMKQLLGKITTSSRGGKTYDPISINMVKDPCIQKFFDKYPNYQLDGEIYYHGMTLDDISGHARKKEWVEERHGKLQFWIFDILADDLSFEERLKILREIKPETDKVVIVEHVEVTNIDQVMALHDKWVSEGYEGGIWRQLLEGYKIGGRDGRMIKVKLMQDAEFVITGVKEGLRPEDMVFVLVAENNLSFEAKPVGTVEKRLWYLANAPSLIGKKATIKFFHLSPKGVPNLPIFKSLREEDE